jgi:hypothetical protein
LRLGFQSVQTPDALGLSGILAGTSQSVGTRFGVGLLYGRVQASDLARTTTSPVVEPGEIPVYAQFLGVQLAARFGPLTLAGTARGHDARFDLFRESGFTVDFGVTADVVRGLRLAASSQFVPADLSRQSAERLYAAVEYAPAPIAALGGTHLTGRYGAALRDRRDVEHQVGIGALFGSRLAVDLGAARERGAASAAWRFVLALSVRAGRYAVFAARGGGLRDVGASYRVGLDLDAVR